MYYDGHERPDVTSYQQSFLDTIFNYKKYMVKYKENIMK